MEGFADLGRTGPDPPPAAALPDTPTPPQPPLPAAACCPLPLLAGPVEADSCAEGTDDCRTSSDDDEPNDALSDEPGPALPGRPPTLIFCGDHAGFGAWANPERTVRGL